MAEIINDREYEAVITMDDEYFINCILELEPLIEEGWYMGRADRNSQLNTMFVTLKKSRISAPAPRY
ncbi:MAG: hypothetical protein M0P01_05400 [Treponema sp.]|nr:hypothetical protein [Treponema sp.]